MTITCVVVECSILRKKESKKQESELKTLHRVKLTLLSEDL